MPLLRQAAVARKAHRSALTAPFYQSILASRSFVLPRHASAVAQHYGHVALSGESSTSMCSNRRKSPPPSVDTHPTRTKTVFGSNTFRAFLIYSIAFVPSQPHLRRRDPCQRCWDPLLDPYPNDPRAPTVTCRFCVRFLVPVQRWKNARV
jgi:hypothetical protein